MNSPRPPKGERVVPTLEGRPRRRRPLDEATRAAISGSLIGRLPQDIQQQLLADAVERVLPARSRPYQQSDPPSLAIVIEGLFRTYVVSAGGREVTIRYAGAGEILGIAGVIIGPAPRNVQVVVDGRLLYMNPRTLRRIAQTDVRVAWLVVEELGALVEQLWDEVGGTVFATVSQRVASHLLALGVPATESGELVAEVTQQELADAVGSVREVVARSVREFRAARLIEVGHGRILIKDPERLSERAWTRPDRPGRVQNPSDSTRSS